MLLWVHSTLRLLISLTRGGECSYLWSRSNELRGYCADQVLQILTEGSYACELPLGYSVGRLRKLEHSEKINNKKQYSTVTGKCCTIRSHSNGKWPPYKHRDLTVLRNQPTSACLPGGTDITRQNLSKRVRRHYIYWWLGDLRCHFKTNTTVAWG